MEYYYYYYFRKVTMTPLLFACEIDTLSVMTQSRINGGKTIELPHLSGGSLRYTYLSIPVIYLKFIGKIKATSTTAAKTTTTTAVNSNNIATKPAT